MGQPLLTCMKGLFLIFNFIFWLTGLGLLVVGIMTKYAFAYVIKLSTDINYNLAPYIMIGCGVFIVLVGLVGCWASIKEHGWALRLYMGILIILFLVEMGGAITGYLLRSKMKAGLKTGMTNAVNTYNTDKDSKSGMDKVQEKIKCCGVTSYADYNKGQNVTNTTVQAVPMTCCKNNDGKDCAYKNLNLVKKDKWGIYTEGCYDKLLSEAKKKFLIVGGVGLGIAIFQILGVICACILTKQLKQSNSYESV